MEQFDWGKWLETQGPLWVIYALTITGLVVLAKQIFKYLPILFEKHMALLEQTTRSVTDSAEAINRINKSVEVSIENIDQQQLNISDAAKPFSKALVSMAHAENKDEVRRHLDEMEEILSRMKK
jgi:hypothetical protein